MDEENRPGSVPIATAIGYGGTDPDFNDPDERYKNSIISKSVTTAAAAATTTKTTITSVWESIR